MYYIKEIFENGKLGDFTKSLAVAQNVGYTITKEDYEIKQSDIDLQYYLIEVCPMKTPEMKEKEERERIAKISLTRGDVFRALYQAKGVTRAQIRAMIENNELISEAQRELALIDFDEALNFYRGNTLIDTLGLALGIISEQLDKFFKDGNYEHLLSNEQITKEDATIENENNIEV